MISTAPLHRFLGIPDSSTSTHTSRMSGIGLFLNVSESTAMQCCLEILLLARRLRLRIRRGRERTGCRRMNRTSKGKFNNIMSLVQVFLYI